MLSYIVIFLVLGQLRRPEQWRRMVTRLSSSACRLPSTVCCNEPDRSAAVGGDVQRRIAGNMGNAIFVAAYLIMAFFLTLERLLEHLGRLLRAMTCGM